MSYQIVSGSADSSNSVAKLAELRQQFGAPQSPMKQLVPSSAQNCLPQTLPAHGTSMVVRKFAPGRKTQPGGRGSSRQAMSALAPIAGQIGCEQLLTNWSGIDLAWVSEIKRRSNMTRPSNGKHPERAFNTVRWSSC